MSSELQKDISLGFHSIHAKQGHFGSSTQYDAARRMVVHRCWGARRRLWGLLPAKVLPTTEETLPVPPDITTEDQLRQFVKQQRPRWLY